MAAPGPSRASVSSAGSAAKGVPVAAKSASVTRLVIAPNSLAVAAGVPGGAETDPALATSADGAGASSAMVSGSDPGLASSSPDPSSPQPPLPGGVGVATAASGAPPAAAAARLGASETVAGLAASMAKRLEGRTSRFDVALNPLGLGRVDVRLEIGADGRASAALAFDRPEAAALIQAHSGELHQALAQAGLEVRPDALTFDVTGGGAGGFSPGAQSDGRQDGQASGGASARLGAFAQVSTTLDQASAAYASTAARGLDIRI